jgi:hypothetical protein
MLMRYKMESRVHCPCELCRMRFGRLFMRRREPMGRWRRFISLRPSLRG